MNPPLLMYFADPMCSWCWGFSPVIGAIKQGFEGRLNIALMLGGLRPGMRDPLTAQLRDEILHHWHEVHKMTGQDFAFEGALPEGFVYDTEPASRAVISLAEHKPKATLDYFQAVQGAFYTRSLDVTRPDILAQLAGEQGVEPEDFMTSFDSKAMREKTRMHFQRSRQLGVRGFPTLILQKDSDYHLLTQGFSPLEALHERIEALLA